MAWVFRGISQGKMDKLILSSKLEQIDEMWIRKMFSLAKSAPKEGIYIESEKMLIRFILMIRGLFLACIAQN